MAIRSASNRKLRQLAVWRRFILVISVASGKPNLGYDGNTFAKFKLKGIDERALSGVSSTHISLDVSNGLDLKLFTHGPMPQINPTTAGLSPKVHHANSEFV